jgi:hypothetical protein
MGSDREPTSQSQRSKRRVPLDEENCIIVQAYVWVKQFVIKQGYGDEVEWQANLQFGVFCESTFLREAAWVILSAGMRESVIRAKFPAITSAFRNWTSAADITNDQDGCRSRAIEAFGHIGKIDAIMEVARRTANVGFEQIKRSVRANGLPFLRTFPYLGPATASHLAKNLGMPVAKPDRHLMRIARAARSDSPESLCQYLSSRAGDPVCVVDIVLWRFATLHPGYQALFTLNEPHADAKQHVQ